MHLLGTRALTYLLTQLARAYESGNISEAVEDRARVVHWLSIATKMYDLE